ncbi:MAG: peptide chain release factor-like protein [Candidatus Omnitrophica bacterium]|nr:peptide chain release factor-like protein [Candidatus Omnitrophota bacterium]MCF7892120.1 peptide chain release factor-like protein [Candidatus Omnitrophota bacterium]MCF7896161.1 peptide chain release factor-like protein [Candidatus Omnitrophota bacterium]MCF7897774.1 peptide chain release factor-like protein [Candidatus Omnitrophota bacterium]MCF7909200.1 peptide chain release factor-like protein [Candidatus Omnitrophota bacterium]
MPAISKTKQENLKKKMERLGLKEADLSEKFIRGGGKGGQKINKTASCVYLKHLPSGVEVKCQRSRSRQENRFFARRILIAKIEEIKLKKRSEKNKKIDKIRKQKRRRSKRAKEKMLEFKKKRSEKKKFRSKKERPD